MAEYIVDTTDGILDAKTTGELVRCRECAYLRESTDARGTRFLCTNRMNFDVTPDGYCAWARRRDGER